MYILLHTHIKSKNSIDSHLGCLINLYSTIFNEKPVYLFLFSYPLLSNHLEIVL